MANRSRSDFPGIYNEELDEAAPEFAIGVEEDEETEEEEEEDDDEDSTEEDEDEDVVGVLDSPGVSRDRARNVAEVELGNGDEERSKRRRTEAGEACSLGEVATGEDSQENEWDRSQVDGLFCPICMDAWTNEGEHHICCLPCGHIYGMSCITRWLKQRKNQGKCPQCNRKCAMKDVRKLFVSRIVVIDEESQKRIRSLETKCASLETKEVNWRKKEAEWRKREAELNSKNKQLTKRATYLERLLGDMPSGHYRSLDDPQGRSLTGKNFGSPFHRQGSSGKFMLQKELEVDGARLFDIDASNQILLIARNLPWMGGKNILTKMSLIPPYERQDILIPSTTNLIKDLHISPSRLAVFASLEKKLSVLSMESDNVILAYSLPAAAWTCSWDLNSSHYMYAGLQNGSVLMFDMRQTSGPVKSSRGMTRQPVHTMHSLSSNSTLPSGGRTVLSASSFGLCHWNFEGADEGPTLIPETDHQGVCISLAYCPSSDDIVASYRPRVEIHNEMALSQPSQAPSQAIGQGVMGSHVLYKRVGSSSLQKLGSEYARVSNVRLPKSAIIDSERDKKLFASMDEVASELILQELPSFSGFQRLKSGSPPLRDIKYTNFMDKGLLCSLNGDNLQIFST
ncbi:hypothetical protein UlMin_005792 [Ulmus minor]